ncbi:MAG: hypothetical protein HXY23_08140 [Parvularculaceae bacterium]|nr:hypothetical protein [Parvularculaceae bacterium]
MAKHYEELAGASGRASEFRHRRFESAELFQGEPPRMFFDDESYDLKNISSSGAAGSAPPADEAVREVNRIGVLRLVQRGEEIFRAAARRARSELRSGRNVAGFALERTRFDLADLQRRNALAVAAAPLDLPAHDLVSPEYKAFCADVAAFVGAHGMRIERLFGSAESGYSPAEREAVFRSLMKTVEPAWRELLLQGNRLALAVRDDKARLKAMKQYTEAAVTPCLVGGATWRRCYVKPMGYPGDYQIMNYMYDQRPEGATLRENFLHGLGLIAGRPIDTRMRTLARIVAEHFAAKPAAGERRVASIGAGPARELEHILAAFDPAAGLVATLVDQEIDALEYAANRSRPLIESGRLTIEARHTSFKSMFDPGGIRGLAGQDVIYSLGLVDYFSPLLATRFVGRAYELVRPGGKVIIGNASDSPLGTYWAMEQVLDWTLYFRNIEEMRALARETPDARVSICPDPLDSIYFLVLEKPA